MNTQFPVVRPSQRIRNTARAMRLSARSEDYPTNADILDEIAAAVSENEEKQTEKAARITELEAALGDNQRTLSLLYTSVNVKDVELDQLVRDQLGENIALLAKAEK